MGYSHKDGVIVGVRGLNTEQKSISIMTFYLHAITFIAQSCLKELNNKIYRNQTPSCFAIFYDETFAHTRSALSKGWYFDEKPDKFQPKRQRADAISIGTGVGLRACITHFMEVGIGWVKKGHYDALDAFPGALKNVQDDYHQNWDCDRFLSYVNDPLIPTLREVYGTEKTIFLIGDNEVITNVQPVKIEFCSVVSIQSKKMISFHLQKKLRCELVRLNIKGKQSQF